MGGRSGGGKKRRRSKRRKRLLGLSKHGPTLSSHSIFLRPVIGRMPAVQANIGPSSPDLNSFQGCGKVHIQVLEFTGPVTCLVRVVVFTDWPWLAALILSGRNRGSGPMLATKSPSQASIRPCPLNDLEIEIIAKSIFPSQSHS